VGGGGDGRILLRRGPLKALARAGGRNARNLTIVCAGPHRAYVLTEKEQLRENVRQAEKPEVSSST